jgi:hypothetical protein
MKKFLITIKTIVSVVLKIVLLLLVILLLTPIGYFGWRAGQPMSMPEYGGLTYFELFSKRRQTYSDLAQTYQASRPGMDVKKGACIFTEIIVELMEIPVSGRYALSAIYPDLQQSIDPRDIRNGYVPENVTWRNILPSSWNVFERFVWGTIEHTPDGPVPYCRIQAP